MTPEATILDATTVDLQALWDSFCVVPTTTTAAPVETTMTEEPDTTTELLTTPGAAHTDCFVIITSFWRQNDVETSF